MTGTPGVPQSSARSTGRWLRPVAGVLVAAVFLYLTLHRLEWAAIREAWRSAAPGAIGLALLALAAGYATRIARWWVMLRVLDPNLPYSSCVRPFLGSLAVNNTMPLRAGDFVRAFGFRGLLRAPPAKIVGTLVVERVLDLVVLLALFFVGLVGVARGAVPQGFITAGTVLFALSLAGVLALVLAPRAVEWFVARALLGPLARWGGRSGRVATRLHGAAEQLFGTLTQVLTPGRAAVLLALSVVSWGLEGGVYAAVAWALHSHTAPFGPFFALATGTLATLLPSSPGYVGTFDYFATLGLTAYGATRIAAAAFALLTHFVLWLPPTIAGGLCFVSLRGRGMQAEGAQSAASTAVPTGNSLLQAEDNVQ
ncbi:MAG: lysylphosphatidylglycerol synthase transmembrane domain-containing protein [Gemmatimonadaceae bacterium]